MSGDTSAVGAAQSDSNLESQSKKQNPKETFATILRVAGFAALTNVANILKQTQDATESATKLYDRTLANLPTWVSISVIASVLLIGNVLLIRSVSRRLRQSVPVKFKVAAISACVVVIAAMFATNAYSLKSLAQGPRVVQHALILDLQRAQSADDPAGFYFLAGESKPESADAWTTAQAIKGLLRGGEYDRLRVRSAFAYIEAHRRPDGWDINASGGDPFVRTEGAAWVALAYLESLQHDDIWQPEEVPKVRTNVAQTLRVILDNQDSRGWWSAIPKGPAAIPRTYSTTIAVWALSEALLSSDISDGLRNETGRALDKGVNWLIYNYVNGVGWVEDPSHTGESFPGLTYQTLFVLERAQGVQRPIPLKDMNSWKGIKKDVRKLFTPTQPTDVKSVPTSYMMIGKWACFADELAYPWELAAAAALSVDPDVTSGDRRWLRNLLRDEIRQSASMPDAFDKSETWKIAESTIGLSFVTTSQGPDTKKK